MDVLVVYESSFGNTHLIADAIGEGLRSAHDVAVVPVATATQDLVDKANLVVVGGPTHVHGMSRPATRAQAATTAHQPGSSLVLDPDAEGPGLRDWFAGLRPVKTFGAAFDTRLDGSALLTGRASRAISKQLKLHELREITDPMSFLVTKATQLAAGQQDSARRWGELLAGTLTDRFAPTSAN